MGELLGGNDVSSSSVTGRSNASEVIVSDKSGPKLERADAGRNPSRPMPAAPGRPPASRRSSSWTARLRAAIATPASEAEPWRVPRARRPTSVGVACFARRASASPRAMKWRPGKAADVPARRGIRGRSCWVL